jgi:hypothetical protein
MLLSSVRTILILFTSFMMLMIAINRNKQAIDLVVFIMFALYLFYLLVS